MLYVRRGLHLVAGLALFLGVSLQARPASADSFYLNFCPGSGSCPTGVTEASLTFTEMLGTLDPNDYTLTLTITGNATSPMYIDEVSFSINGVRTPQDYDAVDILTAPVAGSPWTVFFDNVSASVKSCVKSTNQSQETCTQSDPGGTPPNSYGAIANGTNVWTYFVDLDSGIAPLTTANVANLRAQFLNSDGSNAVILSPGGGALTLCSDCTEDLPPVPEPGSLVLLGTGLVAVSVGLRRRFAR